MALGHWAVEYLGEGNGQGGSGGGGGLVVHVVDNRMDKTWQEIYDAVEARGVALVVNNDQIGLSVELIYGVGTVDGAHVVITYDYNQGASIRYTAASANSYPVEGN